MLVTPGNYGADYLRSTWSFLSKKHQMQQYVGETIDMAVDMA